MSSSRHARRARRRRVQAFKAAQRESFIPAQRSSYQVVNKFEQLPSILVVDWIYASKQAYLRVVTQDGRPELRLTSLTGRVVTLNDRATCSYHSNHEVPKTSCGCGFWAITPNKSHWYSGLSSALVELRVALRGQILEFANVYRAEYQVVTDILVPKIVCRHHDQLLDVFVGVPCSKRFGNSKKDDYALELRCSRCLAASPLIPDVPIYTQTELETLAGVSVNWRPER